MVATVRTEEKRASLDRLESMQKKFDVRNMLTNACIWVPLQRNVELACINRLQTIIKGVGTCNVCYIVHTIICGLTNRMGTTPLKFFYCLQSSSIHD